ncbi:MAG: UpxY family transcription antiterminator [Alloprevotella sp.]|nr:UpxY family transcription antiterminator [Alloprevotella sp.]
MIRKQTSAASVAALETGGRNADTSQWYVLRVTYSRALKVKELLDAAGVESFLPMTVALRHVRGRAERKAVPAIGNIIFVYATRARIDELKRAPKFYELLRYMMEREARRPVTVPEKQMRDFIAVAGDAAEQERYLQPGDLRHLIGGKVRINSGPWRGVEGRLLRVKDGCRVVVEVLNLMAVATMTLHPSMVDPVVEEEKETDN